MPELETYLNDADGLARLVAERVEETARLDFKRDPYGAAERDRRELRRDVTALANASGGLLVVGVEEQDEIAVAVPGVPDHLRHEASMRDIVNALVTPPLEAAAFRVRSIALPNGNGVVVLDVPAARPGAPHGITENDRAIEFWIRRDKTKRLMAYDEVRERFSYNPVAEQNNQVLVRLEANLEAVRMALATHEDPGQRRVREQLTNVDYRTRVYVEPIRPERFNSDVFRIREVTADVVMLEKESNQQSVAVPLVHIESFAPRSAYENDRLLALRPPGALIWDQTRWRFSMGMPATKP